MLDCNSLTLAITDLQLWVLGQDLISDMLLWVLEQDLISYMPISVLMKCVTSYHNEEALNIALVVLELKCSLNVHSKHFGSLIKGYMFNDQNIMKKHLTLHLWFWSGSVN